MKATAATFKKALIVSACMWAALVSTTTAYSLQNNYEYAFCGWGGDCSTWFSPSQYYLNFEPNPQQYEPVETYPMWYSGGEWENEAASWMAYSRVNPEYLWSGHDYGYGDGQYEYYSY